jgi:hypothetical protein
MLFAIEEEQEQDGEEKDEKRKRTNVIPRKLE